MRHCRPISLLLATIGLAGGMASAQVERAGLESTGDEALVQELARYDLNTLLEHYFQEQPAAAGKYASVRATLAVRMLCSGEPLGLEQRRQAVRRVVEGGDAAISPISDPRQLMQLGTALIRDGAEPEANAIEYWGDSPSTRSSLRSVVAAVIHVLDLAASRTRAEADRLAEALGNAPSVQQQRQYTAMDSLAANARYTRLMAEYYRVLVLDPADKARPAAARTAIAALREFDTPESQVQPQVRMRMAKLLMVAGDMAGARGLLRELAERSDQVRPAPSVLLQDEAKYFMVLCDLRDGHEEIAAASISQLAAWEDQNLPADAQLRAAARASWVLLQHRLLILRTDNAKDSSSRQSARAQAMTLLEQLAKDRPDLRSRVFELLFRSTDRDVPLDKLETVALKAIIQQAMTQALQPQGAPLDRSLLERATAACREIAGRRAAVTPDLLDDAVIALPQLLEALGDNAGAARAYLAYIRTSTNQQNRAAAMGNCLVAVGRLRDADPESKEAETLLDEALPIAVTQVARRDLAIELGRRLERQGRYEQAAAAYRQVSPDDKDYLNARLLELAATSQALDAVSPSDRESRLTPARKLAQELILAADRQGDILLASRARLLAARLADGADAALAYLDSIPKEAPADLQADVQLSRVSWLMAADRNAEATQVLLKLLQTQDAARSADAIQRLLSRLDADLERARASDSAAQQKQLLDARAALAHPLAGWALKSPDPDVRKRRYALLAYNASAQREAAAAQVDKTKRSADLQRALGLYNQLLGEQGLALWRETVDRGSTDVQYGDVSVLFGKAQVLFDLGDYPQAAQRFGRLLEDRKLGAAWIAGEKGGQPANQENPQYWEAMYKLYRSNLQLTHDPAVPNSEQLRGETAKGLRRLYIREGSAVGGTKWREQFEALRKELIPDFQATPAK